MRYLYLVNGEGSWRINDDILVIYGVISVLFMIDISTVLFLFIYNDICVLQIRDYACKQWSGLIKE